MRIVMRVEPGKVAVVAERARRRGGGERLTGGGRGASADIFISIYVTSRGAVEVIAINTPPLHLSVYAIHNVAPSLVAFTSYRYSYYPRDAY